MDTYEVIGPLRHNGRPYLMGEPIELTEQQARSLLALKEPPIKRRSPSTPTPEPPPEPPPEPEIAEEAIRQEDQAIAPTPIPTPVPETQHDGLIDLNDPELTVEAIATLSYISEERASAILARREELGGFTELDQVPYLREEHYDKVKL